MRTAPLGCQVSMITLGGVLIGAAGALVIVLLVASAVWAWIRRRHDATTADATDAEEGDRLLRFGREGLGRRVSFWAYNTFLPDNGGGGGGGGTDAAAGGYGTIGGAGGAGTGGYDGSDGGRGGGGVIGRVDSAQSFGSGGLDDGLEERRRKVLERG
ncbi:hypothetical protein B9Z19DRAFT_1074017 [Tuber borchii]|uniref:Uncharacterized protein n=1 Tax=Tuber borchii TaxID=42251 RepID=A0A2T7A534_TUBBO|nr:hypothetical protein B9Z19DRAFT_1074017 [Tuber borchii]